ncbi:MAG: aspartate aminotransferase family protein [Sphaerochaetaceae bacterium]|nr:aspartate aminotransferase family protein [Sphaerochaetaceae bacterium]MDX9809529.1 aspartate aminotransferase family protein [Sphaerochaetaceae bacterium]NLV85180.1 aspartate aminotransferase family protein [Spirochaetales bacterium]
MISDTLFERARQVMVGGVSAGGRYNPSLKKPLLLSHADGCYMYDVDGNTWIDYHSCSGATLLGFNHPAIREALYKAIEKGFFINFESEYHAELCELISRMVPSAEKVRFANSGTEATLAAIRIARGYTGKKRIIKFEGHFHGMHEFVFYNWHNRLGTMAENKEISKVWDSGGMVDETDELITIIPYNDPEILEKTIIRYKDDLAAVICEPVMYNAGCIEPKPGYLEFLRKVTKEHGVVLIFDEVLSGFRMHPGGAQGYYGVTPDLTTLGKVVGCGMTIAAIVGKTEVMNALNPIGKVVVSGTYTGSLLSVMGAIAALKIINNPKVFEDLNTIGTYFYDNINALMQKYAIKGIVQGLCSRFGLYFGLEEKTNDYRVAAGAFDVEASQLFLKKVLDKHMYFHDFGRGITPMHSGITTAHTRPIIDESLQRIEDVFKEMKKEMK